MAIEVKISMSVSRLEKEKGGYKMNKIRRKKKI